MNDYLSRRCRQIDAEIAGLRPRLATARRQIALAEARAVAGISGDEQSLLSACSRAAELEYELALLHRLARALRAETSEERP
jgi:hypothetical protein